MLRRKNLVVSVMLGLTLAGATSLALPQTAAADPEGVVPRWSWGQCISNAATQTGGSEPGRAFGEEVSRVAKSPLVCPPTPPPNP